ncbi:MAG: glycosyltransferase [Haliscomenobacter sp.]|uniref:glycosyltransferase n=1 Tax=Haliscomenobacter sp. TaxID=2717303 RepID=UPI0029A8F4DA|nr:glycosyltransferase [Haliscomenobacter sp.]MDX2068080.1 glycosyltransferase [Haliscomenobacter sp.]
MNQTTNVKPLLCLALPAWAGNYTKSTVELMKAMSEHRTVLYVDYTYTWKDVMMALLGKKPGLPILSVLGLKSRIRRISPQLQVWSLPPLLPINGLPPGFAFRVVHCINSFLVQSSLTKAIRVWNGDDFVTINACQALYDRALQKLPASKNIYYCYDEIAAAQWTDRHAARFEKEAIGAADALVCSGSQLLAQKRQNGQPALQIPNGVDPLFLQTQRDISPQSRPIIGYVGSLDERIDLDLLETVIQALPEYDFSFTGRLQQPHIQQRLAAFGNVQFHPPVAYQALPQRMKHFSAGIIPFLRNDLTAGIYPMKVNEYLALGLPVVSTGFGDMHQLQPWATVADQAESFIQALRMELSLDHLDKQNERRSFAAQQTWQARALQLNKLIEKLENPA